MLGMDTTDVDAEEIVALVLYATRAQEHHALYWGIAAWALTVLLIALSILGVRRLRERPQRRGRPGAPHGQRDVLPPRQ